jgi:hypothetical protein
MSCCRLESEVSGGATVALPACYSSAGNSLFAGPSPSSSLPNLALQACKKESRVAGPILFTTSFRFFGRLNGDRQASMCPRGTGPEVSG